MSTSVRVLGFVATLAAAFVLALGVGRWVGPIDAAADQAIRTNDGHTSDSHTSEGHDAAPTNPQTGGVAGLSAQQDGYRLALADRILPATDNARLSFTVLTSSGRPLVDYDEQHEKDLHLIVVRRDLVGFQHLHPTLEAETGLWSTNVDLTAGTWRVIADFAPSGWDPIVLADEFAVGGDFEPTALITETRTSDVDGYRVTLEGETAPGAGTELKVDVEQDGHPVTDLQPYLGAHGHLVALRAGDLGYLHVHPEVDDPGPQITFSTAFPTAGTYRLFLDFKHQGIVRTADFTIVSGGMPRHGSDHEGTVEDHDH